MSRYKVGSIFELCIDDSFYCYAQLLPFDEMAFFDCRFDSPISDIQVLSTAQPIFITSVYSYIIHTKLWKRIGVLSVRDDFMKDIEYFIYHKDTNSFEIYSSHTGQIRKSCYEECKSLECCAVWDINHIEDRLRDHFNGVPCKWVTSIRPFE